MSEARHHAPSAPDLVPLTPAHLPEALALSQAVGWPYRLEDIALSLDMSQGVGAVEDGRLIATALCAPFGPVAMLHMILVDAAFRGRGLGRRLTDRVMALAGAREMRLVATDEGLPLYRRLGFRETGRIAQHQGIARPARPARAVHVGPVDIATLAAMDTAASGMERGPLLSRIAADADSLSTDGGFALLRRFGHGHVLGPVVAIDPVAARALMSAAATRLEGRFLRIDLPAEHGLSPHAEALGLALADGGTAMVRNPRPRVASALCTHALLSQSMG